MTTKLITSYEEGRLLDEQLMALGGFENERSEIRHQYQVAWFGIDLFGQKALVEVLWHKAFITKTDEITPGNAGHVDAFWKDRLGGEHKVTLETYQVDQFKLLENFYKDGTFKMGTDKDTAQEALDNEIANQMEHWFHSAIKEYGGTK